MRVKEARRICWFAAAFGASCLLATSCGRSEPPQFDSRTPDRIDVVVGENQIGAITNTFALMLALREGKFVPPHPCAARGQFTLQYPGGDKVQVSFYPGHSDSEYEFAVGGKGYSLPRKKLMDLLKQGGIDPEKMPR